MPDLIFLSSDSTSFHPLSPSECYDYMDHTDATLYDEHNFINIITGSSSYHQNTFQHDEDIFSVPSVSSNSTASRKPFAFDTDLSHESHREWTRKYIREWTPSDIMDWIISVAESHNYKYENIQMTSFNVDGLTLLNMTETEFTARSPDFGKILHESLRCIRDDFGAGASDRLNFSPLPPFTMFGEKCYPLTTMAPKDDCNLINLNNVENAYESLPTIAESDGDSDIDQAPQPPVKRLPGRPKGTRTKKKPEKRCGRLWEFIRDLLLNREYCPSLICWDDHDNGVFRFVHSEKVAGLWGTIKENPKMTYEKLSRAMRYYYKSKVLQPVLGRRLVYKFGPTATGWRTKNPNFRLNDV